MPSSKIKPSRRGFADALAWQPESSGIFTIRSAYQLAFNNLLAQCTFGSSSARPDGKDPCWVRVWGSSVLPKVKTFAWRAASNALATEGNKLRRKMRVILWSYFSIYLFNSIVDVYIFG
jgi:hypothetical protein